MKRGNSDHAYRRTVYLLRPHRVSLGLAGLIGVMGTAASLFQPIVIGWVVGHIVSHHNPINVIAVLIALFAVEGMLGSAQVYLLGRASNKVVYEVRQRLVSGLMRAPMAAHASRQRGDVFSTTVADTSIMGSLLAPSLATLMTSSIMVLGSIGFMAYLDPILTGAVVLCVLITGGPTLLLARRLRQATLENRNRVGGFGSSLQRAVTGVSTVKISRAEGYEESRIGAFAKRSYEASMRVTRVNAMMTPAMGMAVQASFIVVFTVGAYRLANGALTTGTFSSYILYLLYLIAPLLNFFTGVAQFQMSVASATRVTDVADGLTAEGEPTAPPTGSDVRTNGVRRSAADAPTLELSDVTFGYRDGEPAVRNVSLTIPARGLTAIVGPSGAGKSTLFGLIVRLWEPQLGRIALRGTDVTDIPLDVLRKSVGFVEQNAAILDGTLHENLIYANPTATAAELDEALELACLRQWVARLPAGLDTQVGEGGTAISGGERQRIAIARMLLVKPDVLLLDEATAHLDAESEAALNTAVSNIARQRAVVTIAHQISTAAGADHVLVVDDGAIRARGTHESLLRSDDLYRRLVRSQYGPQAVADFGRDESSDTDIDLPVPVEAGV